MNEIAILLVDDHPIVREGYRSLLERQPGCRVVAEADNAASAYQAYRNVSPDLVIMDLSLPGAGGLEAVRHIRQWDKAARILVFTMHSGAAFALKAFEAGASGYVTKSSSAAVTGSHGTYRFLSPSTKNWRTSTPARLIAASTSQPDELAYVIGK